MLKFNAMQIKANNSQYVFVKSIQENAIALAARVGMHWSNSLKALRFTVAPSSGQIDQIPIRPKSEDVD